MRVKKSSAELKEPSCACRNWEEHYRAIRDFAPAKQIPCGNPACTSVPPFDVVFRPVEQVGAGADAKDNAVSGAVGKIVPLCPMCDDLWRDDEVWIIINRSIIEMDDCRCDGSGKTGILSKFKKWPRPVRWVVGLTIFAIAAYFLQKLIYFIGLFIVANSLPSNF